MMKRIAKHFIPNVGTLIILGLFLWANAVGAFPFNAAVSQAPAIPAMVNYQGKLTDADGNPRTGTYSMAFTIYSDEGGSTQVWSETHSVQATDGLFNVLLGSDTPLTPSILDGDRWLGVQVETDPEMRPLEPLSSVPYALLANVPDGSITTAKIADGAVTQAKAPTLLEVDSWLPNNGQNWRIAAGIETISVPAGSGHYTVGYVEHSPPFTVPPTLLCSIGDAAVGPSEVICEMNSNPSNPEGAAVIVLRTVDRSVGLGEGNYEVHWLAIGY